MINISHSPYSLSPLQSLNSLATAEPRKGTLLKVEWPGLGVGYADLHPLLEFGERPLEEHLKSAQQKKFSTLMQQILWFAERDMQARFEKKSIFSFGEKIKNNYLVTDVGVLTSKSLKEISDQGFETLKIKVGRDLKAEIAVLNSLEEASFKFRLDFNLSLTENPFRYFLSELSPQVLEKIEYVEDPFPYEVLPYQELNELVPLAVDMEFSKVPWGKLEKKPFSAVVVKPSRISVEDFIPHFEKWDIQMTITSAMDHPVGVVHALCYAQELKKQYGPRVLEAGCLTSHLFKPEAFAQALSFSGPYFNTTSGIGIGFDDLLLEEPWQQLVSL